MTDAIVTLQDGSRMPLPSGTTMHLKNTAIAVAAMGSQVTLANNTSATLEGVAKVNLVGGSDLAVACSAAAMQPASPNGELPAGSTVSYMSSPTAALPSAITAPYDGMIAEIESGSTVKLSGGAVVALKPRSMVFLAPGSSIEVSADANAMPSQRSPNLVRFITIIYGVGIAGVLAVTKPWVNQPTHHLELTLMVVSVGIFLIYGAFSFVMSVSGGPFVYHFWQDTEGVRVLSLARISADVVLAVLYVRALLIVSVRRPMRDPREILFAMAWVFGWVIVIRILRYGFKSPERWRHLPSISTVGLFGLSLLLANVWDSVVTQKISIPLVITVGGMVVISIVFTELLSMRARMKAPDSRIGGEQRRRKAMAHQS